MEAKAASSDPIRPSTIYTRSHADFLYIDFDWNKFENVLTRRKKGELCGRISIKTSCVEPLVNFLSRWFVYTCASIQNYRMYPHEYDLAKRKVVIDNIKIEVRPDLKKLQTLIKMTKQLSTEEEVFQIESEHIPFVIQHLVYHHHLDKDHRVLKTDSKIELKNDSKIESKNDLKNDSKNDLKAE